ncbi:histidine kinase [Salegentibacter sp. Hel_I_6]|uniref:histidine kinase n=1 Tax=Salegentibacter sp. Hel_I_6 TaxID=1250278 RepID=UPI000560FD0B|nr:histidine kinase [Salegentibacter sp. Hel_I_6]
MNLLKVILKELGKAFIVGNAIFAVFLLIYIFQGQEIDFDKYLWKSYKINLSYSVFIYLANAAMFIFFTKKYQKEFYKFPKLLITIMLSVILTLLTIFLLRFYWQYVLEGANFIEFLKGEKVSFYWISVIITLVTGSIFYLVNFYRHRQEKKVKEQKIIAGAASAKFDALKNQLDPHFLFNSLNVLASLIDENPDQAQRFTTGLSKIYRYVLEQKNKELVSLEEELKFANTYMKLLKMRFENSIYFEIPVEISNEEAKVVPLSLQLLLENTIKHNIVSEKRPLKIRIYEQDEFLVVENNYQKKEVLSNRKGVGLQNIVNRYNEITQRKVLIDQTEEIFRVKIPVLTRQISIMETNEINEENAYFKAKQKVKEMKEFHGNLISYCVVIPFLIFINYSTYWAFQWFWFPLFGWGIGLAIHGFSVFGYGSDWEERKIQEIMDKDKLKTKSWK